MAIFQGTTERRTFSRSNFGGAVGNVVEIGQWDVDNGAHSMRVTITASISGFSVCKNYEIAAQFNQTGTTFRKVFPIASPGNYSNNDFNLEAQVNNSVLKLRIVKTAGGTSGNFIISTEYHSYGLPGYSFTESTATGTGVTPDTLGITGIGLETYTQGRSVLAGADSSMPCFMAYASTAPNYGTNNYILPCDTATTNKGGYYDTSTYKFTAPGDGIYAFYMAVAIDNNNAGVVDDSGGLGFSINNSNQGSGSLGTRGLDLMYNPRTIMGGLGGGVEHGYTHHNVFALTSGDQVDARLLDFTNVANGTPVICRAHFAGYKVG